MQFLEDSYYVEAWTTWIRLWMIRYGFEPKEREGHRYLLATISGEERPAVERHLRRAKYRYRIYNTGAARSTTYRKAFLAAYSPPYRCVYCHRKLKIRYMQVDHIISVADAQKGGKALRKMKLLGIHNINDPKNLAPSCWKCNRKKGSSTWLLRGILERHAAYWALKRTAQACMAVFLVWLGYQILREPEWVLSVVGNNPLVSTLAEAAGKILDLLVRYMGGLFIH